MLAATVFVAPAMSHPRGAAPDPDAERSPETPAELAAFVTDCAARLGAKDVGLARDRGGAGERAVFRRAIGLTDDQLVEKGACVCECCMAAPTGACR